MLKTLADRHPTIGRWSGKENSSGGLDRPFSTSLKTARALGWPDAVEGAAFLAHIAEPPADGVRVSLGGIPARVESPPDDVRKMAFLLYVSPHS
jgi:hypothetical protein